MSGPLHYVAREEGWKYTVDGRVSSKAWKDKRQAAREYVTNYVMKYPKYKPLIEGKTWEQIYKVFNITI